MHLGMTGRLLVTTPDAPQAAHTHARLRLKSGREIRFVDPRRFGRLELRHLDHVSGFQAAGSEPLTIPSEEFASLRGRHLPIKAALLNQTLLSGVGNIYADESLFRAGIRPRRQAGKLTKARMERLRKELSRSSNMRSGSVVLRCQTMWTRRVSVVSFSLNIVSTSETGQPCRRCERHPEKSRGRQRHALLPAVPALSGFY